MTCLCDQRVFPPELAIPAGLRTIPRQLATFPEFRAAMLAALSGKPALSDWRARESGDLGIMLFEMWAYVCDAVSFYDETIAHECYLRTSRLRPSLRKLVGLLGYVPRPAIGATAWLAAFADGRQPVALPPGVAFRSGAFDGQPPQLFELDGQAAIHPFTNRWTLAPVQPAVFGTGPFTTQSLLLDPASARLKPHDLVFATWPGGAAVLTTTSVKPFVGRDGARYSRLQLDAPLTLPAATPVNAVKLAKPAATASLWKATPIAGDPPTIINAGIFGMWIFLDAPYRQITAGTTIILTKGGENRWFNVLFTAEWMRTVSDGATTTIKDGGGNVTGSVTTPAVRTPVTVLVLDTDINDPARKSDPSAADWTAGVAADITVRYGMTDGGTVTVEANTALQAGDALVVSGRLEEPPSKPPSRFLLEDANNAGLLVTGTLDFTTGFLQLDQTVVWDQPLTAPVELYGNVIPVSRGETVPGEVLGSGDGSLANQSFTLKKKPLTYLSSPSAGNELGATSTLEIYVEGVRWSEVPSFFGANGDAEVYIVRQADDGAAVVTFGDGVRGRRLPTGIANVVARYRFGAGEANPPAGSIHQLARAVTGLKSVRNPMPAAGGADAEGSDSLQTYAPRSALLLGRAVSIQDMEAAAATVGGVRALRAEWSWNQAKQRPVVQVYYIGKVELATIIGQKLRSLADPSVPIHVAVAQPLVSELSVDVLVDPRYVQDDVLAAVRQALMDTQSGPLALERIGIGLPLYRSRIFAAALAVPGAVSVTGLLLNGVPFPDFAVNPGAGLYYDFESGALLLSGKADVHG